jgi:nucleotide-binding universal stress UspA family protein
VNISAMLARLQTKFDPTILAEQLLLLPPQPWHQSDAAGEVNLLVGYSNSHHSQLALDLTLCIALQTRLVSNQAVSVQMVYVAEEQFFAPTAMPVSSASSRHKRSRTTATLDRPSAATIAQRQIAQFEQADRILWQARSLADEWRGSLKTHLRFGQLATELTAVATAAQATLLVLGCRSPQEALIQSLGQNFPCPILGIPGED